jgi:predicted ATPase/DNA-binding SARP family transcriptional activator
MRVSLLGPLEVTGEGGAEVKLAGVRLRSLLARLALAPGRMVSAGALIDAVWDESPPAGAVSALQSLVSRLRHVLPPGGPWVTAESAGYRLLITDEDVDAGRFELLAAAGRAARDAGDLRTAATRFTEALALWRGAPLAGLGPSDFLQAAAVRLDDLRLRTVEDRADVLLAGGAGPGGAGPGVAGVSGQVDDLAAELGELAAAYPLRERMHALHMRALCAAGRPAGALAAFETLRRTLREELGADPDPSVRELHAQILRGQAGGPAGGGAPSGLRYPLTSFVGRDEELKRLGDLLDQVRLVTLTGTGGAGKTRLAVEIASRRAGEAGLAELSVLVELSGLREEAEVPAAILAGFGSRGSELASLTPQRPGPASPVGPVVEALRGRHALIVLDNCEHLIEACARVAETVLAHCPDVRILATSREPLAITGEVVWPVHPLPVPPAGTGLEQALGFAAIRLFADRAAAVRPGFAVSAGNLRSVGEICRRLDGLPLAIELACARLRTLPPDEVAARLGDRFRLLASGNRTAQDRHRTLLAAIGWSWELFSPQEQALARRLTVFADGATAESASVVCSGAGLAAADVPDLLSALADKSFIQVLTVPGAPSRYRMLETIRAYAAAELDAAGETDRIGHAHARYFLAQAEAAEPALRNDRQLRWLGWLTAEHDNLTAALRWAVERGDAETAIRLTAALGWFWVMRDANDEAIGWLRATLALPGVDDAHVPPGTDDALVPPGTDDALVLPGAGDAGPGTAGPDVPAGPLATFYAFDAMFHLATEPERARRAAAAARRLSAQIASPHPVIVLIDAMTADPDPGYASAIAGLTGLVSHPDRWVAGQAELWLAHAAEFSGDMAGSLTRFASARETFAELGDRWGVASAVSSLATGHSLNGDHEAAIAAFGEVESLAVALRAEDYAGRARVWRGLERIRAGDLAGAREDFAQARAAADARHSAEITAYADIGLAEVARHDGDLTRARALLTGALARLEQTGGLAAEVDQIPAHLSLARVAVAAGDLAGAGVRIDAALELATAIGLGPMTAAAAEVRAEVAVASADHRQAARLLGLAATVRGLPDRGNPDVARTESAARTALRGDYDAVRSAAAALTPAEAIAALSG